MLILDNVRSFVCGFINDSTKAISVRINNGEDLARKLDTESTLECIREQLSNPNENLCIYDNMLFVGPHGVIERIDEPKTSLKEALIGENLLKIKKRLDYLDGREVI